MTNRAAWGEFTGKLWCFAMNWSMSWVFHILVAIAVSAFSFGDRAMGQCAPRFGTLDLSQEPNNTFIGVAVIDNLPDDQLIGPGTVIGGVEGTAFDSIQILANGALTIDNTPCGLWTSATHYTGELIVGTGAVTIVADGRAFLGTLTTLDGGSLSFESPFVGTSDGGLELASGRSIVGFGNIIGEFSGQSGSSVVASGPLTIGLPTGFFDHDGTFDVGLETVTLNYPGRAIFGGNAELTLSGGKLRADSGIFIDNSRTLRGFGTIEAGSSLSQRCVNTGTIVPEQSSGLVFDTILENRGATVDGTRVEFTGNGGIMGNGTVAAEVFGSAGSTINASGQGSVTLTLGVLGNPVGFETLGTLNVNQHMVILRDSDDAILGPRTTLGIGGNAGTLQAVNGILLDDVGDQLRGNGLVDAPVRALSGTAIIVGSDGSLELGDGSASGFEADGAIQVDNSRLTFRDSNEALLGLATTLTNGILEGCNGMRIDVFDVIFGHGIIIGTVSGTNFPSGLDIANNPSGSVAVDVDLSLCANAAIYSQGFTDINSQVVLNGFDLDAPNGIRVNPTGSLTLDGGILDTRDMTIVSGAFFHFNAGELIIDGGTFQKAGSFLLAGTDVFNRQALRLRNGANTNLLTTINIAAFPATFVDVEVRDNSILDVSNSVFVGGSSVSGAGHGFLTLSGSSELLAGNRLQVWQNATMSIVDSDVFVHELGITGGQVTITGNGSALLVDTDGGFGPITGIHIGLSPALTTATIDLGGRLDATGIDFNVGSDTGSLATATVTGLDSTLAARNARVGNLGDGTLNVSDSATATFAGDLTIGQAPSSFGGVTIDGAGSTVTCAGNATVGNQGFGQLRMVTGATFHCLGDTLIGALATPVNPAPGFVIVDGGDWVNDQSIYVGGDATGAQGAGSEIFLKTGGSIVNQGIMQVWSAGKLSLEGGDLHTHDLLIESATGLHLLAGSITVDGGQFRFPTVGVFFGSVDSLNPLELSFVNGADAQTSSPWHIGNNAGTFGITTVSGVANGSRSTLLDVGLNDFAVGDLGDGKLNISNGGLVDIGNNLIIGKAIAGNGAVDVFGVSDGQRATLLATRSTNADLYVGGSLGGLSTGGTGSLDIINGGLVHASGDAYFGAKPSSMGALRVTGNESGFDATLRVDGDLYLAGKATGPGGSADLLLGQGGLVDVAGTLRVWPDALVNIVGGTIRANHIDLTGSDLGPTGLAGGRVEANQITGDLVNLAGTLAPGHSPADVILSGNYTQASSAELEIELTGDDPGTGYDRLQVTGTATLDGTLRVKVVGDYVPNDGHVFTVLTYGARVGEFSEIITDAFLNYEVVYGNNQLQLFVQDLSAVAITGDLNNDGAVSIEDHAFFHACMTGPNSTTSLSPGCDVADIDGDLDVDMDDFRILQLEFGNVATPRVVRWDSLLDGLWSNATNWLGGLLPGVGQSGIINAPGADITVTLDANVTSTDPLDNLLCNERLRLDGGTLSVVGTFQMNNTLELASGNIIDTSIDLGPGASIFVPSGNRPVLDGVTINGTMRMPGTPAGSGIHVRNGLTLNGLITLNGFITSGDAIRLDEPNRMIDGNGSIEFLRQGQNNVVQLSTNGASDLGVLTIGPGITIHGAGGVIGAAGNIFPASIVNEGTIDSDQGGGIVVSGNGSINNGTFRSSFLQGGSLQIVGPWTNNGLVEGAGGAFLVNHSWTNNGTLRLGLGPVFDSRADFAQTSSGTFISEIASASPSGHGQMTVGGMATLDGVLRLEFDNAFVPSVGQSLTVLTYGNHVGEFATIETVGLDPLFQVVPTYNATFLELVIQMQ